MDWSGQGQARVGGVDRSETLRTLYEDKGYSISHLSSVFDCSTSAIIEVLCDIGVLDADELFPDTFPRLTTSDYERWHHGPHRVRVHRLLMVAEHGFEAVANARDIHHESFPWDNRADALVLCETREEHMGHHNTRLDGDHENQRELSEFGSSRVEAPEGGEEPALDEAAAPDVELDPQRTLDEFVHV